MTSMERRAAALRRMAWLCAALVLAVTSLSAFLRLSKAEPGCAPWPQCRVQAPQPQAQAAAEQATAVAKARFLHRVVAVAALLVVLVMAMTALGTSPPMWREGRHALLLLALALFLAMLGRWSANSPAPPVTLGNLLAGFAMFALSCRLAQGAGQDDSLDAAPRASAWALWSVALLFAEVGLGAAVNALHAPMGTLIYGVHLAAALVVAIVLVPPCIAAWRDGRAAGAALPLLLVLQTLVGASMMLTRPLLSLALAHNIVAALLLAVSLALVRGRLALR